MERMALADTFESQPTSSQQTVRFKRFQSVARASRVETAPWTEHGRNRELVETYRARDESHGNGSLVFFLLASVRHHLL